MALVQATLRDITFKVLLDAWSIVCKDEKYSGDKIIFGAHLEDNLLALQKDIWYKRYKPQKYQVFWVTDPKPRKIEAPSIRDRIAQVALCLVIEIPVDAKFDDASYGCRKGKGQLKAASKLSYLLNQPSSVYYLYGDLYHCFPSVDVDTCMYIIGTYFITDKGILWMMRTIMMNECPTGVGLKIGNRWSQLAINIYLNEFDRFLRVECGVHKYIRCADDFVIVGDNKNWLGTLIPKINTFLATTLHMRLNDKTRIARCRDGIGFCGYMVTPHNKVVKKRTFNNARKAYKKWVAGSLTDEEFYNGLASRTGHCTDTTSYKWFAKFSVKCLHYALVGRKRIHYC